MKKLVVFLLLGFAAFALIAGNSSYAAEDDVDLYPYDQQACLEGTNECTQTKLGSSHWTMEFAGYRYHFVKGAVRFANELVDDNSDGFISVAEVSALSWNAFASVTINDTDSDVILKTANARTDLTSVVHRKYSYFDETGQLSMFEDHISVYYIFNDGTPEAADWRLATEAEIDAYDAAEADDIDDNTPVTTRKTHIRMALDDTDTDGYVVEPLGYLKWTNVDVDTAVAPVEDWSTIINGDGVLYDGNPNDVVVKAGWTVVSWGTNDRGTLNPATTSYIEDMPGFMLDDTLDPMVTMYEEQPALFAGITSLDNDLVTDGINIVVDYNGEFDLDPAVTASWTDMFDEEGKIINKTEMLDYSVVISQDDMDLETIDFTYDTETAMYTASAAVTQIDSSMFGAGYKATWMVTTPEGVEKEVVADIVIGVMPPRFAGVADRFGDQNVMVDLLAGITADDGYLNDTTDDIVVSYPASLNPYAPFPGTYQIDLEFIHHVHFDGIQSNVTINGEVINLVPANDVNQAQATNAHAAPMVFTDVDVFKGIASAWGSVLVKVAADGTMMERYDRYNWEYTTSEGTIVGDANTFAAWQAAMTLADDEFIVTAHGSTHATRLRAANLSFGDPVTFEMGTEDFDYDIVTEASYMLTIDDTTAPIAMVVNGNYSIYAGQYTSINNAILANVVAYDFTDAQEDLALYVSNNGGLNLSTPGTYTVEVTVEDEVGHTDVVTFDVMVMDALVTQADIDNAALTEADVQALIDASVLTEADVNALIEAGVLSETAIQALIDASITDIPETGCGSAINGTSAIFITFSLVLGASAVFFFRRRR